jgi:hypothetical protein
MARSIDPADRQPGSLPEIWPEGDSLIFAICVPSARQVPATARLMIRCDDGGNLWARIGASADARRNS